MTGKNPMASRLSEGSQTVAEQLLDIEAAEKAQLEAEERKASAAMKLIWSYDPDSEEQFPALAKAFVIQMKSKAAASRALFVTPMTLHRWIAGTHMPRDFARSGIKTRMIEIVSNISKTAIDVHAEHEAAAKGAGAKRGRDRRKSS